MGVPPPFAAPPSDRGKVLLTKLEEALQRSVALRRELDELGESVRRVTEQLRAVDDETKALRAEIVTERRNAVPRVAPPPEPPEPPASDEPARAQPKDWLEIIEDWFDMVGRCRLTPG
jgi:hypothetical protein